MPDRMSYQESCAVFAVAVWQSAFQLTDATYGTLHSSPVLTHPEHLGRTPSHDVFFSRHACR